jgi:threonine dehydratase
MPNDAPALKLAATRGYGARVVFYNRAAGEDREAIARRIAEEEGPVVVPSFDDDGVIAGQGTVALELLDEVPDLDVILTPCGGGGLLSGVSIAARSLRPEIRPYGVEPEAGNDVQLSFERDEVVTIPPPKTIADSLQPVSTARRNLDILRALAAGILTVSDLELRNAMALAASRMKLVVEPGGAAGFAALLHGKVPNTAGRRIGVVLSGGNVDLARFGELISLPSA